MEPSYLLLLSHPPSAFFLTAPPLILSRILASSSSLPLRPPQPRPFRICKSATPITAYLQPPPLDGPNFLEMCLVNGMAMEHISQPMTQCPTLAQPEELLVTYKLIKLLPTVGCEADAATQYSIDERKIGGSDNRISAFAYQSSGCYVAVWLMENPQIDGTSSLLELEHCLVDPKNRESRVRIIQSVRVDNTKMVLQNVKVFREQWYGPFRNGEQLGGCAVHESGFASTDTMKGSEINGVWQGPVSVARFQSSEANIFQEFTDESVQKLVRDERDIIFLPKQLWCSLNEAVGGETCGEVGWMLDSGHAITSRCVFSSDAKLKEITIASETAEGLDQL
ncbi:uncharacterized protein LOC131155644 isoform X3 [Malania oleifera]|uniref:uncharacterized protein LOC131155644 isoform X3 n=1 Tax=Malania oleifera TaxID=397392 RepID=UPI0025AE56F5|nr:uncharacterized protein LOC131155644 isoform X3 [Malania oleifera]